MTHERIEINPEIMFGKPVIKGTRITVEQILRKLGGGMSVEEIVAGHPHLTPKDVRAAIGFAADHMAQIKKRRMNCHKAFEAAQRSRCS